MITPKKFQLPYGWRILLKDLGINPTNVLRRAGLPEDLFAVDDAALSTKEYFSIWRALEEESGGPFLPLKMATHKSVEAFAPPVFAALCSPDLNTALVRLSLYKRLVCPLALLVSQGEESIRLEAKWLDTAYQPPASLAAMELIWFVQLARIATRERIVPLSLTSPRRALAADEYTQYFGTPVRQDAVISITFSAEDAARPFLTASESMWRFFEPSLRKRLFELDAQATVSEKVRSALLEMLPGGNASMGAVSSKLGFSPRTLHRRLSQEGVSFQVVLNQTREELAKHYLGNSNMPGAEISFLLGYEDPNSFLRAFQQWTGQTPERVRELLQQ
jgi:AraC-like DNA-binding protein